MPTDHNPNTLLLQETAKLFDLVDIVLCAYLYKVCNNVLFEDMLGTDFVNFLNNRPTTTPVAVRPKQKNRVCHILHVVSERLVKPALAKPWISSMLSTCNISADYYCKHRSETVRNIGNKANKDFVSDLNHAIRLAEME